MMLTIEDHAISRLAAGIVRDEMRTCGDRDSGVNACPSRGHLSAVPAVGIDTLTLARSTLHCLAS